MPSISAASSWLNRLASQPLNTSLSFNILGPDLLDNIETLEECGVDVFIQEQDIDTTTPAGKLVFTICGAIATFERTLIQARVKAGLERAGKAGKRLGRPTVDAEKE